MTVDPQRLKELFLSAGEITAPAERAAFLQRECGDDAEIRRRLEVLLHAHDDSGGFLASAPTVDPTPASDADAHGEGGDTAGAVIGPYKLLQQIGEGGMGTVFLAEQSKPVQRKVALKIIKPGMDSPQVLARFDAERQALALMDHPNIAKVLDAGTTVYGRPYFVMELVKGTPITTYCDEQRLPLPQRLDLFVSVCRAIQHAHQKGIIHRDIKPSNVLVATYDGRPVVKVIDFGIAKAMGPKLTERTLFTEVGALVGTLQYMSPEQAELNNLDIDTRSDIYSLGVLLYELLTGTTPLDMKQLRGVAFAALLMQIQEREPPRPSARLSELKELLPPLSGQRQTEPAKLARLVRGDLDRIVMKALEKNRKCRYETAERLARDVTRYLHDEPVEACPPSAGYRARKFLRRYKGPMLAVGAMLLAVVVGAGVAAWQAVQANKARERAENAKEQMVQAYDMIQKDQERASKAESSAWVLTIFLRDDLLALQMGSQPLYPPGGESGLDPDVKLRALLDRATVRMNTPSYGPLDRAAINRIVGNAYWALRDYDTARLHLERSLQLYTTAKSSSPKEILDVERNLAELYTHWGKHGRAEPLLRQLLASKRLQRNEGWSRRNNFPAELPLLEVEYKLGLNLLAQAKYSEAEQFLREFMIDWERARPNSWLTFALRSEVGAALLGQKKYAEAEPLLLAGYQGMKQREATDPLQVKPRLPEALERLVQLYEVTDKKDEAAKWRKGLERIKASATQREVKP
jgi:serine/threonine protein kinase